MILSRRRVGWWEFSALLLSPLCRRCSTPGIEHCECVDPPDHLANLAIAIA